MTPNISPLDGDVRGMVLAPVAFLAAVSIGLTTVAGILLLSASVMLLITALTGYCPVYALFDIRTTRST